jgi:hypothetical protein
MIASTEDAVQERPTRLEGAMRPIATHRDAPGCGHGPGHPHGGHHTPGSDDDGGSASPPLQAGGAAGQPRRRHAPSRRTVNPGGSSSVSRAMSGRAWHVSVRVTLAEEKAP